MPFSVYQLDNVMPPLWPASGGHSLPTPNGTHADAESAVRFLQGEDKLNKYKFQRIEGDLFKRDLLLMQSMVTAANYLATRTGICFNLAATRVWPGNYSVLGRFKLKGTVTPKAFLVASDLKVISGASADTVQLIVRNVTDNSNAFTLGAVARTTAEGTNYFQALNIVTDRGPDLVADKELEVRLLNGSGAAIVATAAFIWQPTIPDPA